MKFSLALLSLVASSLAVPAPKENAHHYHRRDAVETVLTTQTTVVYITDGLLATTVEETTATSEASSTSTLEPSSTSKSSSSSSSSASASASSSSSSSSSTSSVDGDLSDFVDPTGEFEDGVLDCSDGVPTGNGVVSLDWVGLDGWASIMNTAGDTKTTCQDGYYCSYACQAGMSKTQWPSTQPTDGESRGGLICKSGKLYRTNTDTNYLCEWGKSSAYAVSKIDKVVSLCRTDYPGSENMVVPTRLTAGSTKPMSVVDSSTYFKWEGKGTSSQYYINDAGVDVEEGCVWGTDGSGLGNWSPVVAGAGVTDGITYLSIIPNPNNDTPPSYSLKIEGSSGSTVIGSCVYASGKYNGDGSDGCTVSVTSGSANFVFY
ncbi:SUN family protein [Saccharomycopsis crataegensis]|uniref:SUN family protein n=1 Tax=Saccharomycopsis crataegensis TaxID=43959 RepID=A0AAV5QWD5_9ASCO|nr:SUN family protein [Saccharomycopsis crataegensis]